jgi:uncharacterized protein (DUF1330 family)
MTFTEIRLDELSSHIDESLAGGPVHMVNLLRFHPQAQYGVYSAHQRCSGQEAYFGRYIPAFNELMPAHGGTDVTFAGSVLSTLVGDAAEGWQAVGIVRYPSLIAFKDLVRSPQYLELAEPHRKAAVADWRLYLVEPLSLPS